MATCPNCGASSRTDPTFTVALVEGLIAKPLGTFSVAGAGLKTVAVQRMRLSHGACGWSIDGWLEGGSFVGVEATERMPEKNLPEGG